MKKLKLRPCQVALPVAGNAPVVSDYDNQRAYKAGEKVTLHVDVSLMPQANESLHAVVIADSPRGQGTLKVRALHSAFAQDGTRLIKAGAEFDIDRSDVHAVSLCDPADVKL